MPACIALPDPAIECTLLKGRAHVCTSCCKLFTQFIALAQCIPTHTLHPDCNPHQFYNPYQAYIPGSAPPAEEFEKELSAGGGYSAYAAAALAGLPAHDDAVQVARLAAFSGRSIEVRAGSLCVRSLCHPSAGV